MSVMRVTTKSYNTKCLSLNNIGLANEPGGTRASCTCLLISSRVTAGTIHCPKETPLVLRRIPCKRMRMYSATRWH